MFPNIVERLRGTPARVEELVSGLTPGILIRRVENAWSIQENVGHLLDLEVLWTTRVSELREGKPELTAADLDNRLTWERNHNSAALDDILKAFRATRQALVRDLDSMDASMFERAAMHPRLGKPMRMIDLTLFVAEHDDHHLARISQLKRFFSTAESG